MQKIWGLVWKCCTLGENIGKHVYIFLLAKMAVLNIILTKTGYNIHDWILVGIG